MNKSIINHILLFFLLIATTPVIAQSFNGCYKNNNDSISFSNNKVIFNLSDFGALSTQIVGEGSYKYIDHYLIIQTEDYSGDKSSLTKGKFDDPNIISVTVESVQGYPFSGALIEFLSKSKKTIGRKISDDEGKVEHPNDSKIKSIKVSNMGYNSIQSEIGTDTDISIVLAKNNVIQNQIVIIELIEEDEESISIRLLSDDFIAGKNLNKDLSKLKKRAEKSNILSKRLKKEYISVFYNK